MRGLVIVVATAAFVAEVGGQEVLVREGERFTSTHPVVKAHRHRFTPCPTASGPPTSASTGVDASPGLNGEAVSIGTAHHHITVTPHRSERLVCFAARENEDDVAGVVLKVHECEQLIRVIRDACAGLDDD